ncbi:hypothetical protein DGM93_21460 [Xanthomonas phaseoli pv. phaseoli]|nr:hypothetical protein DGM93_21460 [Xanthomonas phaseoli pv. phaseoli]QWN34821.1 hypothetical protein DGM81_21220 [Xanthomonas phaseoli pv. phaseoli]
MRGRAKPRAVGTARASPRTLTPTLAPCPGPRQQRGRSKARAQVARKLCLLAPQERASPKRPIDLNTSKPCSNDSRFPIPDSPPLRASSPAPAR